MPVQYMETESLHQLPTGPTFVTPIGIAISATENPLRYTTVYVNQRMIFMFKSKELTVGDCLIQAGIDINTFYGKIGLSYIVTANDTQITLRGTHGKPPKISVHGELATVSMPLFSRKMPLKL